MYILIMKVDNLSPPTTHNNKLTMVITMITAGARTGETGHSIHDSVNTETLRVGLAGHGSTSIKDMVCNTRLYPFIEVAWEDFPRYNDRLELLYNALSTLSKESSQLNLKSDSMITIGSDHNLAAKAQRAIARFEQERELVEDKIAQLTRIKERVRVNDFLYLTTHMKHETALVEAIERFYNLAEDDAFHVSPFYKESLDIIATERLRAVERLQGGVDELKGELRKIDKEEFNARKIMVTGYAYAELLINKRRFRIITSSKMVYYAVYAAATNKWLGFRSSARAILATSRTYEKKEE